MYFFSTATKKMGVFHKESDPHRVLSMSEERYKLPFVGAGGVVLVSAVVGRVASQFPWRQAQSPLQACGPSTGSRAGNIPDTQSSHRSALGTCSPQDTANKFNTVTNKPADLYRVRGCSLQSDCLHQGR